MKKRRLFLLATALIMVHMQGMSQRTLDIQGHRGARGLVPENTIPAFNRAIDEGVTTLELDVVITKDKKVVVSHEPYMSSAICTKPNGESVRKDDFINIYELTYAEVSAYDCGSRGNARFPQQEKMVVRKPLLSEMIKSAEAYAQAKGVCPLNYNIEIKSSPKGDGVSHPDVAEFSKLVHAAIEAYLPSSRYTLQSFDFRVLKYWNENYPDVRLVALIENMNSIDQNLEALGFTPAVYSPYYKLLNQKKVSELHEKGMRVIPSTVNTLNEMKELVRMGVDGIITDFPNLAKLL